MKRVVVKMEEGLLRRVERVAGCHTVGSRAEMVRMLLREGLLRHERELGLGGQGGQGEG